MTAEALESGKKATLQRRIRAAIALTITWNAIEALVAFATGGEASSAAPTGFSLDSVVGMSSVVAVVWQFAPSDPERREKTALRVIAISFFTLTVYVTTEAAPPLTGVRKPEHSTVGIVFAALNLVVMPFLSRLERRCDRELDSTSAAADSKQILVYSYLPVVLPVGLVLNSLFDRTWADPVVALVIAGFAVREGVEVWCGDARCAAPAAALRGGGDTPCEDDCHTSENHRGGQDDGAVLRPDQRTRVGSLHPGENFG